MAVQRATRKFYLFGFCVWRVISETETPDELEETEETDENGEALSAQVSFTNNEIPAFGFTPWTPHYLEDDE